ncbi:MAG: hypothetical protein C0502_06205 [Opitutus sp.]|nr:hypothetical protein [Opitutus sp.]
MKLLALLLLSALPSVLAQPAAPPANANPNANAAAADAAWAALKSRGPGQPVDVPAGTDAASARQARADAIAAYLRDADDLRDFRLRFADHAAANEARLLEAQALLRTKALGDTAQDARRDQLVADIRRDTAIPVARRAPLAAYSDNLEVSRTPGLTGDARLAAYERTARALNSEFPTMPDGYESLVQIAKVSPDDRAQAIAREILAHPGAPAHAKAEARMLGERHALVGRPLREAAGPILANTAPQAAAGGRPVVLYTWASFSPPSLAQARRLAGLAPGGARLVGVCLDQRTLAPARALAAEQALPGEQVFDWLGRRGELAEALKLTEVGLVYTVDSAGTIRSVSAQRDLAAALAALAQP